MKWNINTHIIGKTYDLTQENMNAMIRDLEAVQALVKALRLVESAQADHYTYYVAEDALKAWRKANE